MQVFYARSRGKNRIFQSRGRGRNKTPHNRHNINNTINNKTNIKTKLKTREVEEEDGSMLKEEGSVEVEIHVYVTFVVSLVIMQINVFIETIKQIVIIP